MIDLRHVMESQREQIVDLIEQHFIPDTISSETAFHNIATELEKVRSHHAIFAMALMRGMVSASMLWIISLALSCMSILSINAKSYCFENQQYYWNRTSATYS